VRCVYWRETCAGKAISKAIPFAGNRYLLCKRAMLSCAIGGSCEQKRQRRIRTADFPCGGFETTDCYSVVARFNSLDALEVID
jgi:hypothetical protein